MNIYNIYQLLDIDQDKFEFKNKIKASTNEKVL